MAGQGCPPDNTEASANDPLDESMDDWPAVDGGFPEGPTKGTPINTEVSVNNPLVDCTDNGPPVKRT